MLVVVPTVASGGLAHVGRDVQQHRAAQVHRRRLVVVEDADVCGVADAEDHTVEPNEVADAQCRDGVGGERGREVMLSHGLLLPVAVARAAHGDC